MDSLNNIQTNSSSELYRKLDDLLSIQTTTISTVKQYLSNQVLDRTQHREAVKAELLEKLRGVLDSYFSAEQQGDEKFATYMKSNFQLVENSIENISNNLLANIQMDANNLSKHMVSYSDALKNIQSENESRSSQLSVDATLAVDYVDSAKSTSEQREKKVSDIIGSYKKLVETKADEFISSEKSFISELTTSLDNHDTDSKFLLGQFLEKLSFEKEGINEKLSFISEAIQLRNNSASHEYQELNNTRNKLVAHVDQLHNETGEHVVSYPSCEGVPLPDETPALWSSEERKEKLKLLQNLLKSEETDNIQHFQELKEPTTFENDENVEFIALSSKRKKTNNDTALNNEEKPTLERVSQRNRTPLLEKS
ncbi:uncharacterized protein LOC135119729 [Zophobas morio]|uniref:uncharacterized protein LOC135119729 n=1 Tax=Zophobas morio TaxID=2755281 RepID=UPI0030838B4B